MKIQSLNLIRSDYELTSCSPEHQHPPDLVSSGFVLVVMGFSIYPLQCLMFIQLSSCRCASNTFDSDPITTKCSYSIRTKMPHWLFVDKIIIWWNVFLNAKHFGCVDCFWCAVSKCKMIIINEQTAQVASVSSFSIIQCIEMDTMVSSQIHKYANAKAVARYVQLLFKNRLP